MSQTPQDNAPPQSGISALLAYHARTRHRFEAYAEGPGQLDWDAQPDPFRRYPGAPLTALPLAGDRYERPFAALAEAPPAPITAELASLGALLELSLGLSAWKRWGPNRWALRCNPSSGNLHPVEAYVLAGGLPGLADGLHHYDPKDHLLEGRALKPGGAEGGPPWLAVGLTSAMWREAWKYGERAFRYCQLDVGHAAAALAYAAALLGWTVTPCPVPGDTLARLLGVDRPEDFPPSRFAYTEAEEPELLLVISGPGLGQPPADLATWLGDAQWQGQPSQIDPAPGYRWPVIGQAALASRPARLPEATMSPASPPVWASFPAIPPLPARADVPGAARLFRQRRSSQRFDPRTTLAKADFFRLLDATLPRPQAPWTAQEAPPAIHLLLFVLRVDDLPGGLYLLPRHGVLPPLAGLREAHRPLADPACPAHLKLYPLAELGLQELQRLARSLSCHQDIAATGAFSLAMVADLSALGEDGYAYRRLLREAGLIGQALYLEAEAVGQRGTGIGCYFDEPVHTAFGLDDPAWQSLYHFTVGMPVLDERIETLPPYPHSPENTP